MQLKYCFKKEWSQFTRTFRLLVILLVFFSMSIAFPALFGFTNAVLEQTSELPGLEQAASVSFGDNGGQSPDEMLPELDIDEMLSIYSDAGFIFSLTVVSNNSTEILIAMLLLMSAAGGEQKKRAMIVPMSSGLTFKNYLIPKFVIYPLSLFAISFLSTGFTGLMCNMIFPNNHIPFANMMTVALLSAVYVVFISTVHLSLGLCTSHPGIMAAVIYAGTSVVESLMQNFGLTQYHPFAISSIIGSIGGMDILTGEGGSASLESQALNITVTIAISLVVCVVMFFLALGVLSAKKINNREEISPEF